ncbi:nitrous oxide reductase family maturation protein NosD [Streptomyces sp. NPDC058964]|uniref:right-handed parallel beta-helix repeat-containing protein n=1 Tax=Streptomyces sp. NPDC058964 TaxID=3346681 RepID=UPI00369D82DA
MTKCHIAYLACTAALLGAGLGATPAAAVRATLVVHPGESIQKAVDAAQSGDTVLVAPGTYYESVKVTTPGLTLRGSGRTTVIMPDPKVAVTPPGTTASSSADTTKDTASCAEGGNGICVVGTKTHNLEGVTVSDLTVTGFARSGVFGMATDGMTVRKVYAVKNGVWGIAQERSVHGVFRKNYARDNGDAGLFLANTIKAEEGATDTGGVVVDRNRLEGNRIGLTVRRLRNLTVAGNYVTGNCAGVFVVGDENKPKAGAVTVRDNLLVSNNKSCPKTERLPALQGSGVVLTGAEDSLVTRNLITGNAGNSPLSGGIVLFKSFVGVTSERNRISDNTLDNNSPADLVNTDTGQGNSFTGNYCRASKPSGLC